MFTCFISYTVDPKKLKEFAEYARTWISIIEKHGGIHHGYFLPNENSDDLPSPIFSFPGIGRAGQKNIAVALFSFPNLDAYGAYKKAVAEDSECQKITAQYEKTKCFSSYERTFLKPIFK